VLMLLGLLGGMSLFGFIGVVVGPMILALALTIGDIFIGHHGTE